MLYVNKKGGIVIKYTTISTYCSLVCLLCHLPSLKKMWYDMDKEKEISTNANKEDDTMNAYAIKPTMPFATTKQLNKTPSSEVNREITTFIDSHDFSFDINKDTGDLSIKIRDKKNEHC